MVKRLLAVAVFAALAIASMGSSDVAVRSGDSVMVYPAAPPPDTTRVVSRDRLFPNTAALTAGYITASDTVGAVINQGSAGQAVRWGWVRKSTPTTVNIDTSSPYQSYYTAFAGAKGEDDYTWQSDAYLGFIAINTHGMKPGQKVNRARLVFNVAAFESFVVPAGEYFTARLDTVAADQAMVLSSITGYAADTDTARMDITWNKVDATRNISWNPPLDQRLDRHDFGPRADNVIGPGTYAAGTSLYLDFIDALQQASDKGMVGPGKWVILVLYGSLGQTDLPAFASGDYAPWVSTGKGCPAFVATFSSYRGPRVWDGDDCPVVYTWDDCWDDHIGYYAAMEAAGERFTTAIYSNAFRANADYDALMSTHLANVDILHHGKTHVGWGSVTGAALNTELELGDAYSTRYWTVAPDTSRIVHAAWPGGTPQFYGLEAISKMVGYGYESCRAFNIKTTSTPPIGLISPLAWSQPANLYAVGAVFAQNIFLNGGSPADSTYIHEKLTDYVDLMYTDYGKAPLVIYAHKASDGVTNANLAKALEITEKLNCTKPMSYAEVIALRKSGVGFMNPALITTANGYTADQQTTAARYDSLRTANSDDKMMRVWVKAK